jgi:ribonuclease T2
MAGQFVLAASWQPAFCEGRAGKPECRSQTPERADARRFSLHGLWPQPIGNQYCQVAASARERSRSGDWGRLPSPELDRQTQGDLAERMPGYRSDLHRHQWTKHGSCYGTDADTYFDHAMGLLDQLNDSSVQALFEQSIGKRLRSAEIRAAFDRDFGPGAGERVRLDCDRQGLITELRIGLKGPINDDSRLGELIHAAPTRTVGCRGGWVDRAGPGR